MRYLILILLFSLTACSVPDRQSTEKTNAVTDACMNSDMAIYQLDDKLYYYEYDDNTYKIKCNQDTLAELDYDKYINSIYASDDNTLYYSYIQSGFSHICRYDIKKSEAQELFSVEMKLGDNCFLYVIDEQVYYYHKDTLWKWSNGVVNELLVGIRSCVMDSDGVYYANDEGVYFRDFTNGNDALILSLEDIIESGGHTEKIKTYGAIGMIDNMILSDDNLYFLYTFEIGMNGGIFCYDFNDKSLTAVAENVFAEKFMINGDTVYFLGKDINNGHINGFYKTDFYGNAEFIAKSRVASGMNAIGFYVTDKLYYYDFDWDMSYVKLKEIELDADN